MDKEASVDNAAGEVSRNIGSRKKLRILRVISILDLIIRVVGVLGTLASALAMGTTSQTLPSVFNQFNIQLQANYSDLPVFTFFVVANAVACGYLFLSLPVSIYQVIRSNAKRSRTILIVFDTVMLALLTSGASAAAAIVYLAHKGNTSANWLAVCQQFNSFCDRITGSLVGSFVAVVALMIIIMSSCAALSRC